MSYRSASGSRAASARHPSLWWSTASLMVLAMCAFAWPRASQAQFSTAPTPLQAGELPPSEAATPRAYRLEGARHLYLSYPMHVLRGRLPPLLHAVAVIETSIDGSGRVTGIQVVRAPAEATEVVPWIRKMIEKAQPFPAPAKLGRVAYTDIWLVDERGRFQLDTLTEGQRGGETSDDE